MPWVCLSPACISIIIEPVVAGTGCCTIGLGTLLWLQMAGQMHCEYSAMRTIWKAFNIVTHRVMLGKLIQIGLASSQGKISEETVNNKVMDLVEGGIEGRQQGEVQPHGPQSS